MGLQGGGRRWGKREVQGVMQSNHRKDRSVT